MVGGNERTITMGKLNLGTKLARRKKFENLKIF